MGITFGRGGATNFQQDLRNADCIIIQGSNMAECHPVGFQWVMEARERGATVIHVDPRFTRTSAVANQHVPIRAGSDIAFLGGLIRYVLEHERYFEEYVVAYTNAANIIREGFQDTEELDGFFSGFLPDEGKYDFTTWQYEGVGGTVPAGGHKHIYGEPGAGKGGEHEEGSARFEAHKDPTLQHPRCVFQLLKRHFQRYTPAIVSQVCGVPEEQFLQVAETLCANSGRERTTAFCYSVGWTQHTVGVQYIRTASILQLLLGNMGRPGGGILALRGHSSIQGSSDIPTLYNLLPGYMPMPHARQGYDLDDYLKDHASSTGWWSNLPKYMVSLLKAWFGDAATQENHYLFGHLPRLTGNHSHLQTVTDMADGRVKGYFIMGENPAVGSSNGALQRKGLRKLDWLVVRDLTLIETAEFWRNAPEIAAGDVRTEDIQTEVFFFPAAAHTEKEGTFTNTQRLLQWRDKAVEPRGDARSELHFVYHLGRKLKALYAGSREGKDQPIHDLLWDYPTHGPMAEPSAEAVLQEINGYTVADRRVVSGFSDLKDDGSTACGCWLYSGCYADGVNQTARRKPAREQSWVASEWGWAWPANRRILYNRASADPEGRPWSERKKYVWWDEAQRRWTGEDVPDFIADRPPDYRPPKDARGVDALGGADPFIMQVDGKGWLYAPSGIVDGPLPTHYEPPESPVENALYGQQCNPVRLEWRRRDNPLHRAWDDPRFPFVLTTYRLTEHHTAGGMSRWLSWLSELQPEQFCEVSPELAAERGLTNGGWATVRTARGDMECRVLVTERMRPLRMKGKWVHQIGLPYHWGVTGRLRASGANDLLPFVADPNVEIVESKAFTGDIVAGRQSTGERAAADHSPAEPLPPDLPELRRDSPSVGDVPHDAYQEHLEQER
ncbi:molybdopterin-dependent oxidoreductase [Pyxidicoccus fallax]|uniref:Molybdopterin-dependent oxidoreductase n=1 Tax=Pyxidicoccus fallax TaxID=394095 RepID=A0A848LPB3_9BACT|nr:molybdopterin-dependent oxidoreductase [Pyxidicoccus fallax]NPC79936.1 molybdopterin-dependent oxidoreductase [Pyxidicoccus fallax]